jgi:hypothetical protein
MQLKSGEEIITKGNKSSAKEEPFPRGVSKPAQRALAAAGYTRLDNLTSARERISPRCTAWVPKRSPF